MQFTLQKNFRSLFALLVCSVYLPHLFYSFVTAILVIMAGAALAQKKYTLHYKNPLPWLFILFFTAHLVGIFLGGDAYELSMNLQTKLSFLFLPFILMVFQPLLTRSYLRQLVAVFFYSSILISIVLLLISVSHLWADYTRLAAEGQQDQIVVMHYFYASILTHDYIHRSYLGLFLGAALFSSPFVMPIKLSKKVFFILGAALLFMMLILLQSRMILIAFVICAGFYLLIKIVQTRSLKWAIYLGLGVLLLVGIGFLYGDSRYNRFKEIGVQEYNYSDDGSSFTGTTIRLAIWENNLDLIKQHPWLGLGYGQLREKRLELYTANNFKTGISNQYNSHNQILETQVVAGLPGSFALLAMFGYIFWITIKRKDSHLFILTLFVLLSMLSESMFERQLAIAFFCTYILAMAMGNKVAFKKEGPA